jgi:hypothetical protein
MLNKLIDWLSSAKRGSSYTYYEGFLSRDRDLKNREDYTELNMLADRAWHLYEDGKVALVQRRVGSCIYQYRVQKR